MKKAKNTEAMLHLSDGRVVPMSAVGGITDVADHFGVNVSTMTTWKNRYAGEPQPTPVAETNRGALYVKEDWRPFVILHGGIPAETK